MTEPATVLSVVIVSWNTRELLLRCLAALERDRPSLPLEAWVVDNASTDGSAAAVRERFPWVRVLANAENRGFAAATNQALAEVRTPYWALLNPDTEPATGALAELVSDLEAHPGAWAAGPQLRDPDGRLQPSGRRFPTLWRWGLEGLLPEGWKRGAGWVRRVYGRTDFTRPAEVDEVSGACFVARRETLTRVGPLDEGFFLFYEEVDWFRRLQAAGGRVRYQPAAVVSHRWGASMDQAPEDSERHNLKSAFRYWRRVGGRPAEFSARVWALVQVLVWVLGRSLLTLLGRRPAREWPARLGRYWNLARLALGARV